MKMLFAALACFFVCGFAQAAPIACSGSILNYSFVIRASANGTKIVGPTYFSVMQSGRAFRHASMRTLSSDIRAGRYLRFSAAGSEASGSVYAVYNPQTGYYTGTLAAAGRGGQGTQVTVNCAMKGARHAEPGAPLEMLFED